MSQTEQFYLQWHGKQLGPWTYEKVRHALQTGEIHSLHQILVDGTWRPLRDYLEHMDALNAQSSREAAEAATATLRHQFEQQLYAEKAEAAKLRRELEASNRDATRTQAVAYASSGGPPPPVPPPFQPHGQISHATRTSGMAIASFVLSFCMFIPFVNAVSWVLSIVFGHIALSQIHRDPQLTGRGLALAGLAITYSMLILGFFLGFTWALYKAS